MKKTIALFLLPLFFLSCEPEPVSDYNAFVESVSGQTYTTVWPSNSSPVAIEIHNTVEEETLPFTIQIGDESARGRIALNALTKRGPFIEAPLAQEIKRFPYRPQTFKGLRFRSTGDGDYTLQSATFEELSPFWFGAYILSVNFSSQDSASDLGLPNLDRIP